MEKIKLSCEMDFTLKLIGGKYKLLILYFLLEDEKKRFNELLKDKSYIDGIIKANAEKANYYAMKTLRKVQKKVGFPERVR